MPCFFEIKMRIVRQYSSFSSMHFNSFLSADSCPKTAIIQYRKLRRYFKKYKFRIWVGELWNFFENMKK